MSRHRWIRIELFLQELSRWYTRTMASTEVDTSMKMGPLEISGEKRRMCFARLSDPKNQLHDSNCLVVTKIKLMGYLLQPSKLKKS